MKWEVSHQRSRKELHLSPGTNRCRLVIKRKAISVRLFLTGVGEKTKVFWCFVKYSWLTVSNVGVLTVWRFYTDANYYTALPLSPSQRPSNTFQLFRSVLNSVRAKTTYLDFSVLPSCDLQLYS